MKKTLIMMSNLELWSIGEGQGAPSFHHTVQAYVDDGWDITLIQPMSSRRKAYRVPGCRHIFFSVEAFDFFRGKKLLWMPAYLLSYAYCTMQFRRIAGRLIREAGGRGILYAYEIFAVKAARQLSRRYGVPFITRFMGTILVKYKNTLYNRLRHYPHFHALAQKSDMVIMTNDGTKGDQILKSLGNTTPEIYFWRNGVDRREATPEQLAQLRAALSIPENAPVLLTACRLVGWKRIDRVLRAMPEILVRFPDCIYVCVGDGAQRGDFEQLARDLGVDNHVRFPGAVPQGEIYKYYALASVFLSVNDIGNLGNPMYDAMIYGKPIVTLNNGDTASLIRDGDNAIMLPVEQEGDIGKAVIRLLSDHELAARLAARAEQDARERFWTWEQRLKAETDAVNALWQRRFPDAASQ